MFCLFFVESCTLLFLLNLLQVEAVLIGSVYVDNVMLHADPFHSYTVALIVANQAAPQDWAPGLGPKSRCFSDFADLCTRSETCKEVLASVSQVREPD